MSRAILKTFILLSLVLASPVIAEDYEALVDRAFEAIDDHFEDSWSFTEISILKDTRFEARYDPRRPDGERWELVSVDGRDPSRKETKLCNTLMAR